MALLTREMILQADDLARELVPVPEWGGEVYVRTMSGAEKDQWEESNQIGRGRNRRLNHKLFRARLVALTVCDAAGKLLFTADDITDLGRKGCKALERVIAVSQRLNAVTDDDLAELEKNS